MTMQTFCDFCKEPFKEELGTTANGTEVRWRNGPNIVHGNFKHPVTGEDCKQVALCDTCLDDEVMGSYVRTCPECDALVDQRYIESNGACPKCGFVEPEFGGPKWI
jgi:hypothetical protein